MRLSAIRSKKQTYLLAMAVLAVVAALVIVGCWDSGTGQPTEEYGVTILSAGTGAVGDGRYVAGATITISAGTPPNGQRFKNWTSTDGVIFRDTTKATTAFVMPAKAVTVTAVFESTTLQEYVVTISSAGTGVIGGGSYVAGATVTISAGTPPNGQRFKNWTSTDGVTFGDATKATTTFIMPAKAVTVAAVFESTTSQEYVVTVSSAGTGAVGDGSYITGTTVTISAGSPPNGQRFKNWTSTDGVTFGDSTKATTAFLMPPKAVTITAVFESTAFVDIRDAKRYETVKIGGKTWMAQNLNYETATGSWCYENSASNCDKYGRLYNWNTAMAGSPSSTMSPSGVQGVCPAGWHLPSRQEWGNLAVAAGGTGTYGDGGTAGTKLKAKSGWDNNGSGTDDFGFAALAAGRYSSGVFGEINNLGTWWTTTQNSATIAYARRMSYSYAYVKEESDLGKEYMYSVRCVAD